MSVVGPERRATVRLVLGVRFDVLGERAPDAEDGELVLRDLRRFSQAIWLVENVPEWVDPSSERYYERVVANETGATLSGGPRVELWLALRNVPQPLIVRMSAAPLEVVADLTPLLARSARLTTVGRLLYLVRHYWNLRLQLNAQRAELELRIAQASAHNEDGSVPLGHAVNAVDRLGDTGPDRRRLVGRLQSPVGLVAESVDVFDHEDVWDWSEE